MKILAVDPGTKRVGLAACDELELTTRLLPVLNFSSQAALAEKLLQRVQAEDFEAVVVGLPLNMDGSVGASAKRSQNLAKTLRAKLQDQGVTCEVILWDERLTSDEAKRRLSERGIGRAQAKAYLDSLAAEVLLQDYLARIRDKNSE